VEGIVIVMVVIVVVALIVISASSAEEEPDWSVRRPGSKDPDDGSLDDLLH
jgi:hypothetical protein